ncbi:hypothetical protein [Candidatus Nitrosocosmicus sp. SS]|jgi:hypothetical protein|uniref:hypothetical protein n=1 Tax=Candidatus Nitrosocosmicus agrestis TaxID=2563600 RepID=UPI00122E29A9|nr:hypothetical protein [Candidatus Nitrosocosmicus sp. SS]KAA2282482.1 hypothetical protein F1Z66_06260 [Candidatus Nitrosocosmicus sp. SS]KAF0868748.1 hypothetical protein E5N71_08695 [Candidatus Nitrosocosmicus sp. SS]MDR4489663.1 hypothetical protein [Candidatus Nitrosocosmicus sp.]
MSNAPGESGPPNPTNPTIPGPKIDGIEITQGIQYYKSDMHLTDPSDQKNDNSVMLVASKPAWVRVYVSDFSGSGGITVTGELIVERNSQIPPIWKRVDDVMGPLPSETISVSSVFDYATVRSDISSTLNFIIPQRYLSYNLRLRANIWQVDGGNKNNPDATYSSPLFFVMLRQTLRLRGIMISYSGIDPNSGPPPTTMNLDAPTTEDLQTTAAWTLTANPVQSQGSFSSAGTMDWSTPLTGIATAPGGCSTEWINLTAAVAQVKTNDGNRTDVIYFGLLPIGTPIQNVGGCALNGVSIGLNRDQVTMAHEIGHAAGLQHAPCNVPGDTNYPAYEPYDVKDTPNASLGEYGLDINNGNIHLPSAKDYMGYCFPQEWISLYHQKKLTDNKNFGREQLELSVSPIPGLPDPFVWPEYFQDPSSEEPNPGDIKIKPQNIISIIGIYNKNGQIEIQSIMRIFTLPKITGAVETSFEARLLGSKEEILSKGPLMRLETFGHECDCEKEKNSKNSEGPFAFQVIMPDVESGNSLNIVDTLTGNDGGQIVNEIWTRSATKSPPKIGSFSVEVSRDKGLAKWEGEFSSPYGIKFSLQFSKDKGRSWNSLAVELEKNEHQFNINEIPVGDLVFRLLVHDGFLTSYKDTQTVIPKHPPIISILNPNDSQKLISGRPMRLYAIINTATTPNLKTINFHIWQIDGRQVGDGGEGLTNDPLETWVAAPGTGDHECTLIIGYEDGKSIVTSKFTTIDYNR